MRREQLHLGSGMSIETGRDFNGRFWIGHAKGASMFFRDPVELRRFLKLSPGIPSRASFDSWIASLTAADAARGTVEVAPVGDANVEGSFDPLAHALDETDPNHQTRTVI
jgi:hypothetical protein